MYIVGERELMNKRCDAVRRKACCVCVSLLTGSTKDFQRNSLSIDRFVIRVTVLYRYLRRSIIHMPHCF